jgi:hypothetical protein
MIFLKNLMYVLVPIVLGLIGGALLLGVYLPKGMLL